MYIKKIFFSRNIYYISPLLISALGTLASITIFTTIFLVGYLMHKKTKQWFPSDEDNKQKVQDINLDNIPDKNVETSYEKNQNQAQQGPQKEQVINSNENNKAIELSGSDKGKGNFIDQMINKEKEQSKETTDNQEAQDFNKDNKEAQNNSKKFLNLENAKNKDQVEIG